MKLNFVKSGKTFGLILIVLLGLLIAYNLAVPSLFKMEGFVEGAADLKSLDIKNITDKITVDSVKKDGGSKTKYVNKSGMLQGDGVTYALKLIERGSESSIKEKDKKTIADKIKNVCTGNTC